jgi:hypothetical protein
LEEIGWTDIIALPGSEVPPILDIIHIYGTITNANDDSPLAWWRVEVSNGSGLVAYSITGSDGKYSFRLDRDIYSVRVILKPNWAYSSPSGGQYDGITIEEGAGPTDIECNFANEYYVPPMITLLGDLDLSGHLVGEIRKDGGYWKVKQDSILLHSNSRRDSVVGASVAFSVEYDDEAEANAFREYCGSDEVVDAPLYLRSEDWYQVIKRISLRGGPIKSPMGYLHWCYDVVCYLESPYQLGPAAPFASLSAPHEISLDNSEGNTRGLLELRVDCDAAAHVAAPALESLVLCAEALSGETWALTDENKLLETYVDSFSSGAKWALDAVGDGSYAPYSVFLAFGESAYYRLSGPWPSRKPVIMTAMLRGAGSVDASANGSDWWRVIDPGQIQSGRAVYALPGTQFRRNIYIRFSGALRIYYLKFEVERTIRATDVPRVDAGEEKEMTISATAGAMIVRGSFIPRRKL